MWRRSTGRQLFVDDFLIEENWLEKRFHQAVLDETPVLAPETPMEWNKGVALVAAPFTDGCWYDPADGVYRLYYTPAGLTERRWRFRRRAAFHAEDAG